jgi:hypothetical protein
MYTRVLTGKEKKRKRKGGRGREGKQRKRASLEQVENRLPWG